EELRQAIEVPAERCGLEFEEGLISRILDDIEWEAGALPLVEDLLDALWLRRKGRLLTQEAYDKLGGVTGALQQRADLLIDGLPQLEQKTAQRLMVRLVNLGDDNTAMTRRRMLLRQLRPEGKEARERFEQVLKRLVTARLLLQSGSGDQQTIEIAHEALIRKW